MEPLLSTKWCREHDVALLGNLSDVKQPYPIAVTDDSDDFLLQKVRTELGGPIQTYIKSKAEIYQILSQNSSHIEEVLLKPELVQTSSWESEPIINLVDSLIVNSFVFYFILFFLNVLRICVNQILTEKS